MWIYQLAIGYTEPTNNYMDGTLTIANYHFNWSESFLGKHTQVMIRCWVCVRRVFFITIQMTRNIP